MRRALLALLVVAVAAAVVLWLLTAPSGVTAEDLPAHQPDLANGEYMFHAGGCASCHAAPAAERCDDPKTGNKLELVGGRCLKTPFGTFHVPNISPDKETGIGDWTPVDFVNAMKFGVGPDGTHFYPAFPYASYQRMTHEDILDLKAYLDTLPAVKSDVPQHELGFPFNVRRGLGLWQLLYVNGEALAADPDRSDLVNRGAYLVLGPGHCSECHSARNLLGGIVDHQAFAGAPNPEGEGTVPNITPHRDGLADWSEGDIEYLLETGHTPDFDVVGGQMAAVQENMAKLMAEDRKAIAAFLKSLPPRPNAMARKPRTEAAPADEPSDLSDD
jgi:mono/diheme cytochrome c family protein